MTTRLPTTDIYFRHACRGWIGRLWARGPIRALGHNCFVAGETMVLIRRDEDALMHRALDWPGRLIYMIDDDIAGAAESLDLPAGYRRRLAQFDRDFHCRLLERADVLLVSSEPLQALFAAEARITARIMRIFPYWPLRFADTGHFDALRRGAAMRIVHLGSGSHAGAFAAMAPAVLALLARYDTAHLTYFGQESPPGFPRHHPRITRIAPMRWPAYRRWLARQRFHLALYPLDATRFDAARSPNKIVEHAVIGAVGLYPESWATARLVQGGSLTAPANPAAWAGALSAAVARGSDLADLAGQAARSLAVHHDPAHQRAVWANLLGLPVA